MYIKTYLSKHLQLNNAFPDAPTIFLSFDMLPILPSKYFTENAPQAVVIWISSQWNILRSTHINTVNNQAPSQRDLWLSATYKGLFVVQGQRARDADHAGTQNLSDKSFLWSPWSLSQRAPYKLVSVFHSRTLCHGKGSQIWGLTDPLLKGSFFQLCDFEEMNTKSLMRKDGKTCCLRVWSGMVA